MSFSPPMLGAPVEGIKYAKLTPYFATICVFYHDAQWNHDFTERFYAPDDIIAKVITRHMANAFFKSSMHFSAPRMGVFKVINDETEEYIYGSEEVWDR